MRQLAHILWALFFTHQGYFNFRLLNNPHVRLAIYLVRAKIRGRQRISRSSVQRYRPRTQIVWSL